MKYYVGRHYDGNISMYIEASSKEEARKKFAANLEAMSADEFMTALDLQEGSTNVDEDE